MITMKKLALTIAIVLGLSMTTFADGGGLFQRGIEPERDGLYKGNDMPGLPGHDLNDNQDAPLGTGIVLPTALGAAYLVGKKRNQE